MQPKTVLIVEDQIEFLAVQKLYLERHGYHVLAAAHTYGSVGRRAKEAGCSGFVSKPCDPRRVLQEVQRRIGPAN